jgi:hypothetical protein
MRFIAFNLMVLQFASFAAQPARTSPIKVPIAFVEALAPKDTTSSERFQKEYETAVALGKEQVAKELSQCGYELSTQMVFYDASDSIQAHEQAKKLSQENMWLLIGPRRSNHYLLFAKGALKTPSVSLMASSQEVSELGSLHVSLAPTNKKMARVAVDKLKDFNFASEPEFLSVVAEDCVTCMDFEKDFSEFAKKEGIKKLGIVKLAGESPSLEEVKKKVKSLKPAFVLVPNYSKLSAAIIHAVQPLSPKSVFIGGDGWGDTHFGFVQNNVYVGQAKGFTVRGFPPHQIGLSQFELGKALSKEKASRVASSSSLAILKAFDGLKDLLCSTKPQTRESFNSAFRNQSMKLFSSPWGVSVFSLQDGSIVYSETRS